MAGSGLVPGPALSRPHVLPTPSASWAKTPAGVGLPPCLDPEAGLLVGRDGSVHFHSLGEETHQPQWL